MTTLSHRTHREKKDMGYAKRNKKMHTQRRYATCSGMSKIKDAYHKKVCHMPTRHVHKKRKKEERKKREPQSKEKETRDR